LAPAVTQSIKIFGHRHR